MKINDINKVVRAPVPTLQSYEFESLFCPIKKKVTCSFPRLNKIKIVKF